MPTITIETENGVRVFQANHSEVAAVIKQLERQSENKQPRRRNFDQFADKIQHLRDELPPPSASLTTIWQAVAGTELEDLTMNEIDEIIDEVRRERRATR